MTLTNPHRVPPLALVVGETVIDIVERDGDAVEHIGGSPANVAVGLARLGHRARLLTRIGRDDRGVRIAAHFETEGVELAPESIVDDPTSSARAIIAADASAEYHFDITWQIPRVDTSGISLLHTGSIALFLEPGGGAVLDLMRAQPADVVLTLDPNIRASLLPDHASALSRFEAAAALSDIVKLSDEDASWLYPELTLEEVAARVLSLGAAAGGRAVAGARPGPSLVVVTLGAAGAFALTRSGSFRTPARKVRVIDTISAGDSFMASLVSSVLERGLANATASEGAVDAANAVDATNAVDAIVRRAVFAAGHAVSAAGANPPRRSDLEASAG